jgi:transcriptional regulator with XRE-family HTH domain
MCGIVITTEVDMSTFGEFVKERRTGLGLTLRAFSQRVQMDAANYSKIERGVLEPPEPGPKLDLFARTLEIEAGSEEERELKLLAEVGKNRIPEGIRNNQIAMAGLPVLFRSLEESELTEDKFKELVEFLQRE